MIRILVVDNNFETRRSIIELLELDPEVRVIGEADDGEEAIERLKTLRPDIVLMDISMPKMNGIEATEIITAQYPFANVIIMSVESNPDATRKMMIAGAKEFLLKPFSFSDLKESVHRVYLKTRQTVASEYKEPEIFTIFSAKGGVGKSVLAANLAVDLANQNVKVLLLDLSIQFGDIAILLGLLPKGTLMDFIQEVNPDYETYLQYVGKYSKNLDVLIAPARIEAADIINGDVVQKLLDFVRPMYDYIVIDTNSYITERELVSFKNSNQILLLTTLDIASIKDSRIILNTMKELNYLHKARLIVSQQRIGHDLKVSDVERGLELNATVILPYDSKTIIHSINQGEPFIQNYTNALTQAVHLLTQICTKKEVKKENVFARLVGKRKK